MSLKNNMTEWVNGNQHYFCPPICNKLMHKEGQLKVFFVGGPNQRFDFHMEEGEEFFYMLKGNMTLVVYEKYQFRYIIIREGEVFLLPARIPHSPQRYTDTVGIVIERARAENEIDCLRYYCGETANILYEKWFYCKNLEELAPLIYEFFESEQYKTKRPIPGTILENKPIKQDFVRKLDDPFSLKTWLEQKKQDFNTNRKLKLFEGDYQSRINVLGGKGTHCPDDDRPETFLWQIEGTSSVCLRRQTYSMKKNDTLLIQAGEMYIITTEESSRILSVVMNPVKPVNPENPANPANPV